MKKRLTAASVILVVVGLSATMSGCSGVTSLASAKSRSTSHPRSSASSPSTSFTPSATRTPAPSHSTKKTSHRKTTTQVTPPTTPRKPPKPKPKPKPPAVTYRDGSYSEGGSYTSPGGTETIRVNITLGNDRVTAVSVSTVSADPTATGYEAQFASGISAAAVGRNIATLRVGAIAGSSLTAIGFNQAVGKIRADAKE